MPLSPSLPIPVHVEGGLVIEPFRYLYRHSHRYPYHYRYPYRYLYATMPL